MIYLLPVSILIAFILDLILGDPSWMPHPVILIGKAISSIEKRLRKPEKDTAADERRKGLILVIIVAAGTLIITAVLMAVAFMIHPALAFALNTIWCWQALAMKGLKDESMNVYRKLKEGIVPARKALSRIVGRDTEDLDRPAVIRAAVETVAENFSDGVFAPLLYMAIGGAPLALTYKAINTMDSMLGYKNEKYIDFGRAAALLDDAANLMPSRIAALLWIFASGAAGCDMKGAARIWRRDRRNHASPNSAQVESACAGALGIRLAGPAYYFGEYYDKPTIGDPKRPIRDDDILSADRIMNAAGILGLTVCVFAVITAGEVMSVI